MPTSRRTKAVPIPDEGNWPCQQDEMESPPPRLLAALYLLMRDHVPPGDLEQVMIDVSEHGPDATFTNPHLLKYAGALCSHLLVGYPVYPYEEAGSTVIGPETIRSKTGDVISYKGQHYELADGTDYEVEK